MLPESRKRALREQIIAAFEDTPHPGDDNISVGTCDDEGTAAYFSGKTWRGHTPEVLRWHDSSLRFFTPEAFRYFLPAYMLGTLEDPEEADVVPGSIWSSLLVERHLYDPQIDCEPRQGSLSPPERQAVAEFVRYLSDEQADYWTPPLPDFINPAKVIEDLRKLERETVAILERLAVDFERNELLCVRVRALLATQ